LEEFNEYDLYDRGWKDHTIQSLLGAPDEFVSEHNPYEEEFLWHRRRVIKAEKTREFILSAYNREINNVIKLSDVKKLSKEQVKNFHLKITDSRNQQKKELIVEFYKKTRNVYNKIEKELIFSFTLKEMINVLENNSFKDMLTDDILMKFELEEGIRKLGKIYDKSYTELYKEFEKESTREGLDKLEEKLNNERAEKNKKFREITKVEDIENFYKEARSIKRNFKAFLGPTNSGKTYNAIQELIESKNAVYLAPLRLLAREVYDLLISKGLKVSLITGEEKIIDEEATHTCSTIEALNIHKEYDLAVIDEVQFLNDRQRGSSWTRAVYGVYAKNVICLGSQNTEKVLHKILRKTDEDIEIIHLERKTILSPSEIIYNVDRLKKGDAVIAFSRNKIYQYKEIIEDETSLSVGVVYGMMPPEIRIKTAQRFNNGEIDIIIATDAIGIGLNLEIQRIVFTDLDKYNGFEFANITTDLFKQIAGRAGRYKKYDEGFVTICEDLAYKYNEKEWSKYTDTLHHQEKDIEKIYFFPELEHLLKIADELEEKENIRKIIKTYETHFQDTTGLFIKNFSFIEENLEMINQKPLSLETKYRLLFAPVSRSNKDMFKTLLNVLCEDREISFDDFDNRMKRDITYIEEMIQDINIYRWMHFAYPDNFKIGNLNSIYEDLLKVLDLEMVRNTKGRKK